MGKIVPRDITPGMQLVRTWLLGRPWKPRGQLRYVDDISPRPGPQPNLPDGPAAALSSNYYFTRDARREAQPPTLIASGQKQLGSGDSSVAKTTSNSRPVPGVPYVWTESNA